MTIVAALGGGPLQLEPPLLHGGMDDGIERRQGGVIAHDLRAQRRAI